MTMGKRLTHAIRNVDDTDRCGLELSAWKDRRTPDAALFTTSTREDLKQTKARIGLFRNLVCLSFYTDALLNRVRDLELRWLGLRALNERSRLLSSVQLWFTQYAREPVTKAEYARRELEARQSVHAVSEALEPVRDGPDSDLVGECNHHDALSNAAALRLGSFPSPSSEFAGFAIVPDSTPEGVAQELNALQGMRKLVALMPSEMALQLFEDELADIEDKEAPSGDPVLEGLTQRLKSDVRELYGELASFRTAIAVVSFVWFSGHDPLMPFMAASLHETGERLEALAGKLAPEGGRVELPEPNLKLVEAFRSYIERSIPPSKPDPNSIRRREPKSTSKKQPRRRGY